MESVQIHKDRKGESKGIAYVKFSKTSEAALAVEEMNGRCLGHHPRPLKVKEELLLRILFLEGATIPPSGDGGSYQRSWQHQRLQ